MGRLVRPVAELTGQSQRRLLSLVTNSVGLVSAFVRNIVGATLFLPAVVRISYPYRGRFVRC